MAIEGSGIKAPSKKATRMAMATYRVDPLDKMIRDIDKASKKLSGQESTGAVKETGRGMGDTFNPFKDRVDASPTNKGGFFSPDGAAFDPRNNVKVASADLSGFTGSDFSVANDANKVTGIVNQVSKNLADASYDTSYKKETSAGYEDSYKQFKQIFDKPIRTRKEITSDPAFQQAVDRGRFGSEEYKDTIRLSEARRKPGSEGLSDREAIDRARRKGITYGTAPDGTPTATDAFDDKVEYSPRTIKRYIATDAKEDYKTKQKEKLDAAVRGLEETNRQIKDLNYYKSQLKYDEKGRPDPMNKYILTAPQYRERLKELGPNENLSPYGTIRSSKEAAEIRKRKEESEQPKKKGILQKTGDLLKKTVEGVSRVFTPSAEAATPESAQKAIQQTTGQTRLAGQGVPFGSVNLGIAKDPSNVAKAQSIAARNPNVSIDKSGVARPTSNTGVARAQAAAVNRTLQGKTVSQVNAENRQKMRDRAKARNEARKKRIAASRGRKSQTRSGTSATAASAKTAVKKSRSFNRSKSRRSGPSGATSRSRGATGSASRRASRSGTRSSSSSRRSTGRAGRRGGSAGSAGSRSRGATGSKSRRSSSRSRSSNTSRSRRRSSGARRSRSRRRGRRGRRGRRCDLRCKFNIMPLTNMNLIRDDLAEVAYFVKELQA